ncbi:hypothetical protein JQ561_23025 [Bradyrhizobium diazoefficiens]|uniref:hypothetical protein n=1 Tax=Bradyrhizobium sp. WYCCWR 12699 TaxID=3064203 RepID=UPI001BAB63E9|nr:MULTISPECIES: hypothetical protein [Bradyrhizobium]MBR0929491.1 hypothetical protein [Bradyrhizobium diazoefficiens]MDT4739074.1 hypothetical protein [Bradyrhizobium sp. WYCCWR 12699]
MLRVDFGKTDLSYAQLIGIKAGDYLNPSWDKTIGDHLHKGDEGDNREGTDNGDVRRKFVTHSSTQTWKGQTSATPGFRAPISPAPY